MVAGASADPSTGSSVSIGTSMWVSCTPAISGEGLMIANGFGADEGVAREEKKTAAAITAPAATIATSNPDCCDDLGSVSTSLTVS